MSYSIGQLTDRDGNEITVGGFYGGATDGPCVQITLAHVNEYIQLDREGAKTLAFLLKLYLDKSK